jgi:hypothetical protein
MFQHCPLYAGDGRPEPKECAECRRYATEERAAILQFEAGLSRAEADRVVALNPPQPTCVLPAPPAR